MEHVSAEHTPGELPGVTATGIILGLCLVGEFVLPSVRRLMPYPADRERVLKALLLLDEGMIRAIADGHPLRTFGVRREGVLVESAVEFFTRLPQEYPRHSRRLGVIHISHRLSR